MVKLIVSKIVLLLGYILSPLLPVISALFVVLFPQYVAHYFWDINSLGAFTPVINATLITLGLVMVAGISNIKLPSVLLVVGFSLITTFRREVWFEIILKLISLVMFTMGIGLFVKNGPKKSFVSLGLALTPTWIIRIINKRRQEKSFTLSPEWIEVRNMRRSIDGECCSECGNTAREDISGRTIRYEVDHILPKSKFPQFALDLDNTRVLCNLCNSSKGARYGEKEIKLFINNLIKSGRGTRDSLRDFYYDLLRSIN